MLSYAEKYENIITPEMVYEAFKRTGLRPVHGSFVENEDGSLSGCALTALAIDKGISIEKIDQAIDHDTNLKMLARLLEIPDYFDLVSFYDGFDENRHNRYTPEYEIGQTVRQYLREKNMIF